MDEYNVAEEFERIEHELIASMMRNFDKHRAEEDEKGINWSQWQVEQLQALEEYKKHNAKKYGTQFKDINSRIDELIKSYRKEGNTRQEVDILKAIKKGMNYEKTSPGVSARFFKLNDKKIDALINATKNDFTKAEYAMLRRANDQYRQIVFRSVLCGASGGTYEKAVDMAAKEFLRKGIDCIEYKNGSRHNIKDYADMAIKTAGKRAYLTGEGEKRKEYGISTVIMNKRGNPCPKCLPFVGKVMIDDVWSGGKASDGPYMLMSDAIAKGLYHPRCKDSHSTYYPSISSEGAEYTKEEKQQVINRYNAEQKENYAESQAEKFGRLAEYSLDGENRRGYEARVREWKERTKEFYAQNLDNMGLPKLFSNEKFKVKAYEIDGKEKIYTQTYSKDAQNTIKFLSKMQDEGIVRDVTEIVVIKDLPGIAAYDHVDNILYVNEKLSNELYIAKNLSSNYFVAENAEDVLKHEMYHKKHWDNIMTKGKDYVRIKHEIESELHKYVAQQQSYDKLYISRTVSKNAERAFIIDDNLNEVIAEVLLQEEKGIVVDKNLLMLVRRCIE